MKQLVTLRTRPSRDGSSFKYYIDYVDENNNRRQISLGHADKKKAERQRAQKERELKMGLIEPNSMKLSVFLEDSVNRTRGQIRESSIVEVRNAMNSFIGCVGDIDFSNIKHADGERFIQHCLEKGNSPATVGKKIRHLKRLFQLAKERGQLEENPLKYIKQPKVSQKHIRIYTPDERSRLLKAAQQCQQTKNFMPWELIIQLVLTTGMRRGELLNLTWRDIDFDRGVVYVAPKHDTDFTWQWHIKDTDRRTLPLTKELVTMLVDLQSSQSEGNPYVFISPERYKHIQRLRRNNKWSVMKGSNPLNNFYKTFISLRKLAGIEVGTFHDLRRTCLSNWLSSGLSEFEVMNLAGHAKFETTRKFYLAVNNSLIERARKASTLNPASDSVARLLRTPEIGQVEKRKTLVSY